jgi:hypothetical protein
MAQATWKGANIQGTDTGARRLKKPPCVFFPAIKTGRRGIWRQALLSNQKGLGGAEEDHRYYRFPSKRYLVSSVIILLAYSNSCCKTLGKLRLKPTRRLLRRASPRSLKNPGPDLALTEIFCLVKLPHSRETIDGLVLSRQGGLDINVKVFAYEDG